MIWYKKINFFSSYNLLSIRVFISCLIAFFIADSLHLPRSYWSILSIISVGISIHSRDILFRTKAIVISTIIGCLLGTLLYYYLDHFLELSGFIILVLFLSLLTLYFTVVNYAIGVFFNSIFMVMFFGTLSYWNYTLFIGRVLDIAIGAVIILCISFISRNPDSIKRVKSLINKLYKNHEDCIQLILDKNFNVNINTNIVNQLQNVLEEDFLNLKAELKPSQAQIIESLISTLYELTGIYENYNILSHNINKDFLLEFSCHKIIIFHKLLKQQKTKFNKIFTNSDKY